MNERSQQPTLTTDAKGAPGVKCSHCDGKGRQESYYDEDSGWMEEIPCETCGGSGRITTVEQYLKTLPADWHEDSSLQKWFPLSMEEFERTQAERDELLKALEDLSFECDGVTSVASPTRETYNRTFAVLRKIRDGVDIEVPK